MIQVFVQAPRDTTFYYVGKLTTMVIREFYNVQSAVIWNKLYEYPCLFIGDISQLIFNPERCEYAWVDSCYTPKTEPSWVEVYKWWKDMATTSYHNAKMMEHVGFRGVKIIPRPINPRAFLFDLDVNEYENRPYDFFMIGRRYNPERKNMWIAEVLGNRGWLRGVVVTPDVVKSPFVVRFNNTISDEAKFRLMRSSKVVVFVSSAEGFGMPVVEAMAVGTVLVYGDIPAVREWAVGIPVKPSGYTLVELPHQTAVLYHYEPNDVLEAVKYALGLSREEREDLLLKARESAFKIFKDAVVGTGELLGLGKPFKALDSIDDLKTSTT